MSIRFLKNLKHTWVIVLCLCLIILFIIYIYCIPKNINSPEEKDVSLVPYNGKVYHIFFHSLILYPELAFHDIGDNSFKDYMVTKDEFNKILPQLYENNFILVNSNAIYGTTTDGFIFKKEILLPNGKKPLILSIDDVNYQTSRDHKGFAKRLVLDKNGDIATEVITPTGDTIVTHDGDIMPILNDFVISHPDFSLNGAKGIIAETGFDGVFGYRTNIQNYLNREKDVEDIKAIVSKLRETGWQFASHSYSHQPSFKDGTISVESLKWDTDKWEKEVRPFVGDTNIFIGPFGQIFNASDPRRNYLLSKGFNIFYGVGMDLYIEYFPKYFIMNRADIDGIRLTNTPYMLKEYFDPATVIDPKRNE
jgi:hypothetical protein